MSNKRPQKIIILGIGGNCLDILDTILDINQAAGREVWDCVGFLDDDPSSHGRPVMGVKVLGPIEKASIFEDCQFVNGIGSPKNFWKKFDVIAKTGLPVARFATLIHPSASISRSAHISRGVTVLPHAAIAARAWVGDHVIILHGAVISHDVRIGDYSCVTSSACISGGVEVGRCCYLGSNCSVIGGVRIGENSLIGMGSVVLKDVPAESIMAGTPAERIRSLDEYYRKTIMSSS